MDNNSIKKNSKLKGIFLRLPEDFQAALDDHIEKNNDYYNSRTQFIRIAIAEKMKRDTTSLEGKI